MVDMQMLRANTTDPVVVSMMVGRRVGMGRRGRSRPRDQLQYSHTPAKHVS